MWEGLDAFFEPGRELLVAETASDTIAALELTDRELSRIAQAGRERTLSDHTSEKRAVGLERALEEVRSPQAPELLEVAEA